MTAARDDGRPVPPVTEVAYARKCLGMIDLAAGQPFAAEAGLREAVALATSALGEDHPVTATYQANLALTLLAEGRFDRAALLLRRAEFVIEAKHGVAGPQLAAICAEMSAAASGEGKLAVAEDYALRAISILGQQDKPNTQALSIAQVTLAGVYLRAHSTADAEKILPAAVAAQRQTATNPHTLAASIQLLGELRVQQRNWRAAETLFREAIGIYERGEAASPGSVDPAVAPLLRALADVLKHEGGSKDEVRALETQARNMQRAVAQAPRA